MKDEVWELTAMKLGQPPVVERSTQHLDAEETVWYYPNEEGNDSKEQEKSLVVRELRTDQAYAGDKPPHELSEFPALEPMRLAAPVAAHTEHSERLPGVLCVVACLLFLVIATLLSVYLIFRQVPIQEEELISTDSQSTTTYAVWLGASNQTEQSFALVTAAPTSITEEADSEKETLSPVLTNIPKETMVNASVVNPTTLTEGASL